MSLQSQSAEKALVAQLFFSRFYPSSEAEQGWEFELLRYQVSS